MPKPYQNSKKSTPITLRNNSAQGQSSKKSDFKTGKRN